MKNSHFIVRIWKVFKDINIAMSVSCMQCFPNEIWFSFVSLYNPPESSDD